MRDETIHGRMNGVPVRKSENHDKVLVIGLDGATFDLMLPWVTKGLLPNLGGIMQEGVYGDLMSVMPPESPQAWASFATGKNPGKHGVFGAYEPAAGNYTLTPINARSNRAQTLYRLLNDGGKRVITVGVPFTSPPEPLDNSIIVPGALSKPAKKIRTPRIYPPELQAELGKQQLHVDTTLVHRSPTAFLKSVHTATENLTEMALYLLQHKPWDFFMLAFTGVEQVERYFYRSHESRYSKRKDRYQDAICAYYQKIDAMVGKLLAQIDQGTTIYVMSDHGMQHFQQYFCLNLWLHDNGFLSFKQPMTKWLKRQAFRAFARSGLKSRLLRAMNLRRTPADTVLSTLRFNDIDFDTTRAYACDLGGIRLNVVGRELRGVVRPGEYERMRDTLIDGLHDLIDEQGQAFRAYRREEIYSGDHLERAPDIVVTSNRYCPNGLAGVGPFAHWYGAQLEDSLHITGMHDMNGIFIAKGPHIHSGQTVSDAQLIDLAPTILYNLNLPIPEDMDGRPLTEVFIAQHRNLQSPRYAASSAHRPSHAPAPAPAPMPAPMPRNSADHAVEHGGAAAQPAHALHRSQPEIDLATTQRA